MLLEKQVHLQNEEGSVLANMSLVLVRWTRARHVRDLLAANTSLMFEKILKKSR